MTDNTSQSSESVFRGSLTMKKSLNHDAQQSLNHNYYINYCTTEAKICKSLYFYFLVCGYEGRNHSEIKQIYLFELDTFQNIYSPIKEVEE